MKVYLFGNQDLAEDNFALHVAQKLQGKIPEVEFVAIKPNEDLPFADYQHVVLMDVVLGINKTQILKDSDLEKISSSPRNTAHDFDLGFQLKYLKKLGKLGTTTIIGLPLMGKIDYSLIQSILRKLVAQDIQGS